MKRVIAAGIATLVCFIALIVINTLPNNAEPSYEAVRVTVVDSSAPPADGDASSLLMVSYQGAEYVLQGATAVLLPSVGTQLDAYLSDGQMYADPADIGAAQGMDLLHRLVLSATMASAMCTLFFWTMHRRDPRATQ